MMVDGICLLALLRSNLIARRCERECCLPYVKEEQKKYL